MFLFHIMRLNRNQRVTTRSYLQNQIRVCVPRIAQRMRRLPHANRPIDRSSICQTRLTIAGVLAVPVGQRHILRGIFCTRFELCDVRSARGILDGRTRLGAVLLGDHLDVCAAGQSMGKTSDPCSHFKVRRLKTYFFSDVRRMPTGNCDTSRHAEL